MKYLKYQIIVSGGRLDETAPPIDPVICDKMIPYSAANEEIAKREAYNGEYTIEDDGKPEPPPTTEQRVSDLEEQIVQADETAIALYEAQEEQETINAQQDEILMELYEMIG